MTALYLGTSGNEIYAGALESDGRITTGRSTQQLTIGRASPDGSICAGRGPDEHAVGQVRGDEIYTTGEFGGRMLGRMGADGTIFTGSGVNELSIGRVQPPDARAAAALLLLVAHDPDSASQPPVRDALGRGLLDASLALLVGAAINAITHRR